eukprot:1690656-Pleurochrysis_carterae.AAC.1
MATAVVSPTQSAWRSKRLPVGDALLRPCGKSWLRSRTRWAMESAWSYRYIRALGARIAARLGTVHRRVFEGALLDAGGRNTSRVLG